MFDKILEKMCEEFNCSWWTVVEDLVNTFEERVAKALNCTVEELEHNSDYCNWFYETSQEI